ncbi:leucine-rich repeat-containing protein 52 [Larus michahellis]|uniref:leucine-rich repeat-containing protein 52 n=1 Tax=Larus michahellis TaxID=119627 RepID=UPI003D9B830C
MSPPGRPRPLTLMFLLGMGMASERINCPSRCSCQYLEVNCTGQQLQEFPVAIPLDTRQLILAANNVSYLPAVELSFLADLVYLDCSKNLLGDDLDFTFIGVAKLVYLDLSFNNITQVTFSTFSHLLSLVVLKISDNPNLVAIEKDAFANNTWLRHLDVSRTGLTFLDTSTVQDLPNLRFLGLSDNLWHCNCSFLDFITWMTESNVHFPGEGCVSSTCLLPAPADLCGTEGAFCSLSQNFNSWRCATACQLCVPPSGVVQNTDRCSWVTHTPPIDPGQSGKHSL